MNVRLLTKHHLEFLSLKGGCTGSHEPTLVKMPYCWKSHATAKISFSIKDKTLRVCLTVYDELVGVGVT